MTARNGLSGLCLVFGLVLTGAVSATASSACAATLSLDEKLDLLIAAYPDSITGRQGNFLTFADGGPPIEIDDGKTKIHAELLEHGDIEDSLEQDYQYGPCVNVTMPDFEPGRIRSEALLKRLYGNTAKAVRKKLVRVKWFGKNLDVTSAHGVNKALEQVEAELSKLPDLRKYLTPSGGTFNWRTVKDASNLSVHSFGAAIDINPQHAQYWLWKASKTGKVPHFTSFTPLRIVDIFERHGFIWGGRWHHFDSMHFEYRPELIAIAKAMGNDACG